MLLGLLPCIRTEAAHRCTGGEIEREREKTNVHTIERFHFDFGTINTYQQR